jgi:hypothetical protein
MRRPASGEAARASTWDELSIAACAVRRGDSAMMSVMRRFALAVAVLGLEAGVAGEARAEFVTLSGSVNASAFSFFTSQPVQLTAAISIQKFDSSLGVLDSMQIEFSNLAVGATSMSFDNEATTPFLLNARLNAEFAISAGLAASAPVSASGPSSYLGLAHPDQDGSPDFFGDDALFGTLGPISGFSPLIKSIEAGALSFYTGSGTVDIGLKSSFTPTFTYNLPYPTPSTSPAYRFPFSGVRFTGDYKVTYNYTAPPPVSTAVPEPASVAMLGTSVVVGLGVARRRWRVA